jgi:hypothetical protein
LTARCLFVVDEIAQFREVAIALDSRDVAMTMVKEFKLAERLVDAGGFDMVIVGTNTFASESMRFLQRRRVRRCPVLAVTCQSGLQRTLVDSGADRVILLPDTGGGLKAAFDLFASEQPRARAEGRKLSRLWQHLGL